jgi:hypothetical protein
MGGKGLNQHIEVVVSGASPYVQKTQWSPEQWNSPLQMQHASGRDEEDGRSKAHFDCLHKFLAWQLASVDIALAAEIINSANHQRLKRVRQLGHSPSKSMQHAFDIVVACRGKEPHTPGSAEAIVRRRIGKDVEHLMHVYGFIIHLLVYPITMILAFIGYIRLGLLAATKIGDNSEHKRGFSRKGSIESSAMYAFVMFCFCIMLVPTAAVCVVVAGVPDLLLILVRPILPLSIKLALPWFSPSSLAFWTAGPAASVAFLFLGASPVDEAFMTMSLGGELCTARLERLPPSSAFQAAVICSPYFLSREHALRRMALRGVPEFHARAGGPLSRMPVIVQWGYLLGDSELCAAWEAECMGCLADMCSGGTPERAGHACP